MTRTRVLGIDPGATTWGWAVLEVVHDPGVRISYLCGGVGNASASTLLGLLQSFTPGVAGVETPAGFAFEPGRVPALLRTARTAGGAVWLLETRGVRVVEATAQQTRKMLCGKANADDAAVAQCIRGNVFGLPMGSIADHVADAVMVGVVAAWVAAGKAALPAPKAKAKRPGRGVLKPSAGG